MNPSATKPQDPTNTAPRETRETPPRVVIGVAGGSGCGKTAVVNEIVTVQRGRTVQSVIAQYLSTVRPMHLEFVEPSKRHAHVIIPEGAHNTVGVDILLTKIRSVILAR